MPEIRIGTSGWSYQSWRGPFFPKEVKVKDHLAFYATQFRRTESTAPSIARRRWKRCGLAGKTPDDFLFAWKASKFITHWKRLTEKCETASS